MNSFISKKIILITLAFLTFVSYALYTYASTICVGGYTCSDHVENIAAIALLALIPGLVTTILLLPLKKEVFLPWLKFYVFWVLSYVIVVSLSPDHNGGYIGISSSEIYSILGLYIFGFISLSIVFVKLFLIYRKK